MAQFSPRDFSVLFITLDSCNFDTAQKAKTPTLNSISRLKKAYTSSTYTYPAHHSFFLGNLPELVEDKYYFQDYGKVWRSTQAWATGDKVAIRYDTSTIIKFYEKEGFDTRGFGGVGFFNNQIKQNILPRMFKSFVFFESKQKNRKAMPRDPNRFPLNHVDEILSEIDGKRGFFLFINELATHVPYDSPKAPLSKNYPGLSRRLIEEHYLKKSYQKESLPFTESELQEFKKEQIRSLEWADQKIRELVAGLPRLRPVLILVCGDHGEEFGEGGKFGHFHYHPIVMTVPLWCGVVER